MSKKIPPHLPPPVCNIEDHKKWLRVKLIVASAVFGLFSGVVGAAMMFGWIWPNYGGGDIWTVSKVNNANNNGGQLEEKIAREIGDRIFFVYSAESVLSGNSFLKKSDKLGDAIVIGSDGWLAMYLPNYVANYRYWSVLSSSGSVFKVEKAVYDRLAKIVYFKLSAPESITVSQFKVANFTDSLTASADAYIYMNGVWDYISVGRDTYTGAGQHLDTAPVVLFETDRSLPSGSVVIDRQGRVVGVSDNQNRILPSIYLTRIIPEILSKGTYTYNSLGVDGWFGIEQPIIIDNESIPGFAVSRVWGQGSPLRRGDVIVEVAGRPIEDAKYLWYNKDEIIKIKVLRGGKYLQLESKVFAAS